MKRTTTARLAENYLQTAQWINKSATSDQARLVDLDQHLKRMRSWIFRKQRHLKKRRRNEAQAHEQKKLEKELPKGSQSEKTQYQQ